MKPTGIKDRNEIEIKDGDWVSLDGNMTADDTFGELPNGWVFEESDVYQVYFDERINNWSLKLGVEPDTEYNCKYMSHAVRLLHNGCITIVDKPKEKHGYFDKFFEYALKKHWSQRFLEKMIERFFITKMLDQIKKDNQRFSELEDEMINTWMEINKTNQMTDVFCVGWLKELQKNIEK